MSHWSVSLEILGFRVALARGGGGGWGAGAMMTVASYVGSMMASFFESGYETQEEWEAREALAKLVKSPLPWDFTDVPLPRPQGPGKGARRRAFVI